MTYFKVTTDANLAENHTFEKPIWRARPLPSGKICCTTALAMHGSGACYITWLGPDLTRHKEVWQAYRELLSKPDSTSGYVWNQDGGVSPTAMAARTVRHVVINI